VGGIPEGGEIAAQQQVLVVLAHWQGRVMQYSPTHPASLELAGKVHASLTHALETMPQLVFGILKDNVMIGEVAAVHPAVRLRIASHLHDRGVLMLRFVRGVSLEDLQAFVELLLLPAQTIFDRGGLLQLTLDRGVARIQIEELAHDISEEELASGRRRRRLREFFADALRNLLGRRPLRAPVSELVLELLEHPDVAVTILEDQGAGLAEAAAGMALLVRQEEQRTGRQLVARLRAIFAALAPMSRDRILLGFPSLVGEFRSALAWAMRGYREHELAAFAFPAVRTRAHELDVPLYALSVLVPHDGTRLSTLRRVGSMLHDLPLDDSLADEVLAAIARPGDEHGSYRRERQCLGEPALRAMGARSLAALALVPEPSVDVAAEPRQTHDALGEMVRLASRTRQFERFCRRLPDAAGALAASGTPAAVLELVRALLAVEAPEARAFAAPAAQSIAAHQAAALLAALEPLELPAAPAAFARLLTLLEMIVVQAPAVVLDHLDDPANQTLRKHLLELLPRVGPRLAPLLRVRLTIDAPPQVVELVALLARVQGRADDLVEIARHRDEKVRLEVIRALRGLPACEKTMDLAVRYLADSSPEVRVAVRLLVRGEWLGTGAIHGIGRLLADPSQPEEVLKRLVQALGRSRHDTAAQLLFKTMEPKAVIDVGHAAALRELAAAELKRCPAASAPKLFDEGLHSTSRRVRKVCERVIKDKDSP